MKKTRLLALFIALLLVLTGSLALGGCSASAGDEDSTESQVTVAEQEELDEQGEVVEEVPIEGDSSAQEDADNQDDSTSAATEEDASVKETELAGDGIEVLIDEDGEYTSKDEVALYIHVFSHLPSNYITKREAENAGWKTKGLTLAQACPGKSIGGDKFSNREGRLPKAKGRTWYECDIDYQGGRSRNAKRILYSDDGLIYYTEDHYKTFDQLY